MEKVSQKSVDYRKGDKDRHCGNCVMFHAKSNSCDLVEGHIEPDCVCNKWEARKVSATTKLAAMSMQARSLDIPTEKHPNKMPFSGILTRIDEPSDAAPDGSGGARVMITMEAAEKALDSLLGMAVDYQQNWDGHDPQAKIGVITGAEIQDNAIRVNGFIYAADFPEVAKQIKANKHALGMSFEARDLMTTDPKADPIPIFDCVFTGAAILLRDKAAYKTTSISAQRGDDKEGHFDMTAEELKQHLDAALKPINDMVAAQAAKIEKMEQEKIEAANHLAKIEPHAKRLEDAADKMDDDGIGGDEGRGHAKVLRQMAGEMRADAAQGKMPHIFYGFHAKADVKAAPVANAEAEVKAAVEKVTAEFEAKFAEVKAGAEKVQKELEDKVAATETKLADLKAEAEKKVTTEEPKRKTLSPSDMHLMAKASLNLPEDGSKLEIGKLNKALADAHLTTDQRFQIKTALARVGAID